MRLSISNAFIAPVLAALLIVLPWVNPFAQRPSSTVQPMLVSVACAALLLAVSALARTSRQALWRAACWAWVLAAAVNAAFALLQYFDLAAPLGPWVNLPPTGQVFGNVRQRNLFATLCVMGLAALAWGTPGWRTAPNHGAVAVAPIWLSRWGAAAVAMLLGVGLAISFSRTGLLELVLLWLMMGVWRRSQAPSVARVLAWGTAAYLLASWLLPWLTGQGGSAFSRLADSTGSGRRVLWANVWQLVLQKPWLGWGWGELGYAHFITLFEGPRFGEILDNAHNLPLHLAVTLGLPLTALVMALLAAAVYRAQPWRAPDAAQQLAWAVLAVISLHSLLEYPLWHGTFQTAAVLCVWYLYGCRAQGLQVKQWLLAAPLERLALRAAVVAVAVVVLAACGLAADSYRRVHMLFVPAQFRPAEFAQGVPLQRRDVMLFVHQVSFTRLGMELTPDNAQESLDIASNLLHFNANYYAVERIIASLEMLGRQDEAHFYEVRYAAAFPEKHAEWVAAGRKSTFFPYKLGP